VRSLGEKMPHLYTALQHSPASRRILRLAMQLIKSLQSASIAETSERFGETGPGAGAAPPDNPAVTDGIGSAPPSLMELPSLAADNLGDLHQNLARLVKGVIQTNLRTSQEMLRVTNHNEFVALQQRFVRDYMAALVDGSLQLVAAIQRRTAGQMLPAFDQSVEQHLLKAAVSD
jgi:phasin protein